MLLCLGQRVIWQRYADRKLRRPGQRPDHTSKNLCLSLCNKRNTSLYNWFRKLTPFSQLIRFKSNTNRDLVTCVFPRFRQLAWFHLNSHWLFVISSFALIGSYDYFCFTSATLNRNALKWSRCQRVSVCVSLFRCYLQLWFMDRTRYWRCRKQRLQKNAQEEREQTIFQN